MVSWLALFEAGAFTKSRSTGRIARVEGGDIRGRVHHRCFTNIYRKLGVANRTEAVRRAYELGLIESPLYDKS